MEEPYIPGAVKVVQDIVSETIGKQSISITSKKNILSILQKYPKDLIEWTFGDFGRHLLSFNDLVFYDHPSLSDINNATLMEGGKVYCRVSEMLQLAEVSREKNFSEMPEILRSWFCRNHQSISKVMSKPPARLIRDEKIRNEKRRTRHPSDVDLSKCFEEGRKCFDSLPSDFVPYTRMGPGFRQEVDYYKRMISHLSSLGMLIHAKCLASDMEQVESVISEKYAGFIRVKMSDVALVAAKSMKARWMPKNPRITIPAAHFTQPFWKLDTSESEEGVLSKVLDKHVVVDANYKQLTGEELRFAFSPRVYPYHMLSDLFSESTISIVEMLESHPDSNGRPLFDNYWVLVPSVGVKTCNDSWRFYDGEKVNGYADYWNYATALDRYLIRSRQVFGILLAEQVSNKNTYFICYCS